MKYRKAIVLFMCILLLFSGCTKETTAEWGSFTAKKTYSYDEKYYAVQTVKKNFRDGFDFIKVSVYETETNTLVDYFYPARSWDFCGICWENDTYNIWTQSGDIGIYCYKYADMKWEKDISAERPEYIISKYDKQDVVSESRDAVR